MSRLASRWVPVAVAAIASASGLGLALARRPDPTPPAGSGGKVRPVNLRSEGPTFTSLSELVDASAVVVLARVGSVSPGRTFAAPGASPPAPEAGSSPPAPEAGISPPAPEAGRGAVRSQVLRLEVGAVLAGPDPGATLAVEEVAELADGTPVVLDGLAPAEEGDQGFWFLAASADRSVPYLAAVGPQGRYLRRAEAPGDDRLVGAAVPDQLVQALAGGGGRRLADEVVALARARGRPVRTP